MVEVTKIKAKYDYDQILAEKTRLEELIANAHTSTVKVNISQAAADLNYYSILFGKVDALLKKLNAYEQASQLVKEGADAEMSALAQEELTQLDNEIPELDEALDQLQIERKYSDPDDMRSVIVEIRAGAGGDEASLFAADLFRMYSNFATSQGWVVGIIDSNVSESAGYKEVIAKIEGKNAYKYLKYESGVHRVQRIPVTETGGRIHTSTASVAILPEAQEVDVEINPQDIRIDTMRASGAGGQKTNKTDSAIRITHFPTGIVVSCQETKVQQQNKAKAMEMLRAKLYERKKAEELAKRSDMRSSQIGTAMRAEKIRTYNYPQSRITDHRIKISWHNLEEILAGNMLEMLEELGNEILKMMLANEK
ncbi:MAG: peptide chain release factor 1 [Candidatus Dojkabacteria bacterium]